MRGKEIGDTLYNSFKDFSTIIDKVLHKAIIPLLPLFICGTFVDMTKSGRTFVILGILWKVFLVVIIMHLVIITIQFVVAGAISRKNPFVLIKNQIPAYTTAIGTQSSAATIPVNLECAKNDGVSEEIRNFVVPLCANIHMAGSIMTALPFLYMIFGKDLGNTNGPICALMVALYITQDSFGTACNVSGDNAIGVVVESIYQKFILKK